MKENSLTFTSMKLFMILLGCTPAGRLTEQHDIFFGIGSSVESLVPQFNIFWPEANGELHIDSWREVTAVDNHSIEVISKENTISTHPSLFFINLGGYKENDLEEYHYKLLSVDKTLAKASKKSMATAFYKHCGFKGAESHLDEKYGIDIDDIHNVAEILPASLKSQYALKITKKMGVLPEDKLHVGYLALSKLTKKQL